jgi:hypothetical protein
METTVFDRRRAIRTYRPPVKDVTVLYTSNPRHAYTFGDEFGRLGFIAAASFGDAYDEMLDYLGNRPSGAYVCDHGGDITDEQRMEHYAGESDEGACDCSPSDSGVWVRDAYLWIRYLRHVPTDLAMLDLAESFA